jgi:hypothetical protein
MIKTLKKLGRERMYFNTIKAVHDKSRAYFKLSGEKVKLFPLRSEQDKDAHCHHSYSVDYFKS